MSNNMKDRFVYSNFDEVDIVLDTDKTTGDVTVSVSSSNLDNVATLHYDGINVSTEDFSLYGAVKA